MPPMTAFLVAVVAQVSGGLGAAATRRRWPRVADALGTGGCVAGVLGAVAAGSVLFGGDPLAWKPPVRWGFLALGVDPLAALVLAPVLLVSVCAALFGRAAAQRAGEPVRWAAANTLAAAAAVALAATHAALLIAAAETMLLAAAVLTFGRCTRAERWLYFGAMQLAVALLVAFFLVHASGGEGIGLSPGADALHLPPMGPPALLGLAGFAALAAISPLIAGSSRVPGYAAALLSASLAPIGIYGILRVTGMYAVPPWWWGAALLATGLGGALGGALRARGQAELRRFLACMGLRGTGLAIAAAGLAALGMRAHATAVALIGFAAALLHVVGHVPSHALLLLGADAVEQGAGTLELDGRLGGLLRRMRDTGATFLAGALSAAALPAGSLFPARLLLYAAALAAIPAAPTVRYPAVELLVGLALADALAIGAFGRVFRQVFLGRGDALAAVDVTEVPGGMRRPMHLLALLCIALGMAPLLGFFLAALPAHLLTIPMNPADSAHALGRAYVLLRKVRLVGPAVAAALMLALVAGGWAARRHARAASPVRIPG